MMSFLVWFFIVSIFGEDFQNFLSIQSIHLCLSISTFYIDLANAFYHIQLANSKSPIKITLTWRNYNLTISEIALTSLSVTISPLTSSSLTCYVSCNFSKTTNLSVSLTSYEKIVASFLCAYSLRKCNVGSKIRKLLWSLR